ncbi:MAG: hypothetical protein QOD80_80 [Verrucomicrobiota bacterium]|jgi:hypothetical protein
MTEAMPELDERTRRIMEESEARHAASDSVAFDTYRRRRFDELNAWVRERKTVYLDMKYWIWLRDPDLSPFPAETKALRAALSHGVKTGRLFCPVSYPACVALMRIHPLSLRLRQAELMDDLCLGVAIRNGFDMAEIEFCEFFGRNLPALQAIPYRVESVWCRVGQMVVEKYLYHDELPPDMMERGRKVMLDVMWERKMTDYAILEGLPEHPRNTAFHVNLARQTNPRGRQSFEELFAAELHGALDVLAPRIEEQMISLARIFGIRPTAEERAAAGAYRHVLINLFREVVTRGLDAKAIPSLRVRSALHASIRMDDRRPFRQNDLEDIAHSSVAVSYSDVFLTERSFAELLNRGSVQAVITPSKCRVVSNVSDALAAVAEILGVD